tara:strand:- start:8020 stop:8856 length:837 start_codon:yes stop_codon:yes gene_type:complete
MFSSELWQKSASGGGGVYPFQIEQSCRFTAASNDSLSRSFGTSSNLAKFTFSCWIKRSLTHNNGGNTVSQNIIGRGTGFGGGGAAFGFESDTGTSGGLNNRDRINWYGLSGAGGGSDTGDDRIAGYYYDTNAWYHLVVRVDTGESAATKIRYYVNGVLRERVTTNEPTGNMSRFNTNGDTHYIGALSGANYDLDAYLAEVNFADGQSYGPDQFGESFNGVWQPISPVGTTYGTNGFRLDFANSSDLGNDVSGNSNDWTTVSGTLGTDHKVLDSPTFGD